MLIRISKTVLPPLRRYAQNRGMTVPATANKLLLSLLEREQIELVKEARSPRGQARALLAAGAVPELMHGEMCVPLPDGRFVPVSVL